MLHLDHILYAVPDLAKGMGDFERLTGVRPAYGGRHAQLGTHNALVSLGDDVYLELIAPDPDQRVPVADMIFDIGKVTAPKIMTWAVRATDIQALGAKIRLAGIEDGSRITADGTKLEWKTAGIAECNDTSGIVPFVIQWGDTPHPARTAPRGCVLLQLSATHPSPQQFRKLFSRLSFPLQIVEHPSVRLTMKFNSPRGVIVL